MPRLIKREFDITLFAKAVFGRKATETFYVMIDKYGVEIQLQIPKADFRCYTNNKNAVIVNDAGVLRKLSTGNWVISFHKGICVSISEGSKDFKATPSSDQKTNSDLSSLTSKV